MTTAALMTFCARHLSELGGSCNGETLFSDEQARALRAPLEILLPPDGTVDEAVRAGYFKSLEALNPWFSARVSPDDWREAMAALRLALREKTAYATAYKHLFFAAMHATRPAAQLVKMIAHARSALGLADDEARLISDATLELVPELSYAPRALPDDEAYGVMALACVMLRIDAATHVNESAAFRDVLNAVGPRKDIQTGLRDNLKAPPAATFSRLSSPARVVAILATLRIAAADLSLVSKERALLETLFEAARLGGGRVGLLIKAVELERGTQLAGRLTL